MVRRKGLYSGSLDERKVGDFVSQERRREGNCYVIGVSFNWKELSFLLGLNFHPFQDKWNLHSFFTRKRKKYKTVTGVYESFINYVLGIMIV